MTSHARAAAGPGATSQAEVVFRCEWGRAVAVVTRLTGDLSLAEDAVQEAFAAAVARWSSGPLPSDPSGWLITVAKNHAVDRVRREAPRSGKEQAAMLMLSQHDPPPAEREFLARRLAEISRLFAYAPEQARSRATAA